MKLSVNSLGIWWDKRMPTGQISGHVLRWRSIWSWFVLAAVIVWAVAVVFLLVLGLNQALAPLRGTP